MPALESLHGRPLHTPEVDIDPATVETNIVRFRLRGIPAAQFVDEAHRLGVHMLPWDPLLCERYFISTLQTRTLNVRPN